MKDKRNKKLQVLNEGSSDWYYEISRKEGLPRTCPFMNFDKCSHYYESWVLLAQIDLVDDIEKEKMEFFNKKWKSEIDGNPDPFRPSGKNSPTTYGAISVKNICPEIGFYRFGFYSSHFSDHLDEIDKNYNNNKYPFSAIEHHFWRSNPMHFSDCRSFCQKSHSIGKKTKNRASISPKLRFSVLQRDKHLCQYCGASYKDAQLQVDHKISIANGGSNDLDNLTTSCSTCNFGKGRKNSE